jgi:hypothetical protein
MCQGTFNGVDWGHEKEDLRPENTFYKDEALLHRRPRTVQGPQIQWGNRDMPNNRPQSTGGKPPRLSRGLGRQNDPYHVRAGVIIICFVTFLCIVEQGRNSMAEPQTNGQFEIYVIADRLIDVLPYSYEDPAWRKLLETPPCGTVILADKDIETYNWEDQEIILSSSASERLSRLKLIEKSFVAYLGKRPLFGGSFIEPGSARAINYPVIYIDKSQSQIVFQLRPIHWMFDENYRQWDAKLKRRIELADVRRHFRALGKLR